MMNFVLNLLICTSFLMGCCESARILAVMPQPFYSHQMVFRGLWKELSSRGHHVTLLTTDPINDPKLTNLTEIDLHFVYDLYNYKQNISDMIYLYQTNMFKAFNTYIDMMNDLIDQELSYPKVQNLIRNESEHFDLLIVEFLHPTMYAFSERFKCPYIGISPLDVTTLSHEAIGNPVHPALNPEFLLPFEGDLTFVERLISTLYSFWIRYYVEYYMYPKEDATVRKHFGNNFPPLQEIEKKVSMLFLNTNPVYYGVRPMLPSVIQIGGGIHIQPPKPLPKDLQEFLDNAREGVIYFSLGTNVKSENLCNRTKTVIIETFAEMPYRVIWKFESDRLPLKSKNVKIQTWLPQQDLLRHQNIKLFITQGGLQSIEEAIYNAVPLLALPFFGDQQANAKRIESKGIGLRLDYKNLDKTIFKNAIMEIINNKKYKSNIKKLSILSRDQEMNGIEKAVWWTEYILRHKGAKHFKSPILELPFYQYYLLDIILFFVALVSISIYLLLKLLKFVKVYLFSTTKNKLL